MGATTVPEKSPDPAPDTIPESRERVFGRVNPIPWILVRVNTIPWVRGRETTVPKPLHLLRSVSCDPLC